MGLLYCLLPERGFRFSRINYMHLAIVFDPIGMTAPALIKPSVFRDDFSYLYNCSVLERR